MKKILIISSTPVKGGNSALLCEEFARGAQEAGHQTEIVPLREKSIGFCRGCEACVQTKRGCVQKDDMTELITKMHEADIFVLATPIYFMSVCAQLKVFIDRFIAGEDYIRNSNGKKAYFIAVSASTDTDRNHLAATESFRGFLKCLRTVEEGGVLNAGGAYAPGEITGQDWMQKAYEMGRQIS